ncbi:MAG: NusG domain II-containing protein [Lachnospiraceae bacterium]
MEKSKKDLLLIAIILVIAAAGFSFNYLVRREPAVQVEVSVDGQVICTLNLNQDTELDIQGWNGGTNHLIIRDGAAWIDEASCPDKICIGQGKIRPDDNVRLNQQMIACRPNRVLIRGVSQED